MSGISVRLSMLMVALALIVAIAAPGAAGALPGVGPGDGPTTLVGQVASPIAAAAPAEREVRLRIRAEEPAATDANAAEPPPIAGIQVTIHSAADGACTGLPLAGPLTTDASGLVQFTILIDRLLTPAVRVRAIQPGNALVQATPCALVDLASSASGSTELHHATLLENACLPPAIAAPAATDVAPEPDLRLSNIGSVAVGYALWVRDSPSWAGGLVLADPLLTGFHGFVHLSATTPVAGDGDLWWPVTISGAVRGLDPATRETIVQPNGVPGTAVEEMDLGVRSWSGWLPQQSLVELAIEGVFPASMLGPQAPSAVAPAAGCQGTTGASVAILRDEPAPDATGVSVLMAFTHLDILEGPLADGADAWFRVAAGSAEGWLRASEFVATGYPSIPAAPAATDCPAGKLQVGCLATNLTDVDPGLRMSAYGVLPIAPFAPGTTCKVSGRPLPNTTAWELTCAGTAGWVDAGFLLPEAAPTPVPATTERPLSLAAVIDGPGAAAVTRAVFGVAYTVYTDAACAAAPLAGPLDAPTGRTDLTLPAEVGVVYIVGIDASGRWIPVDGCQPVAIDATFAQVRFTPRQPDLVATATANANATATANANATATANANATATANANATATANANATATANANATATANANATATANANATATANANATATANANATATANANATATARANATATARANATATARANATATANANATATARANASATANANATATARANATATANANATGTAKANATATAKANATGTAKANASATAKASAPTATRTPIAPTATRTPSRSATPTP